LQLSAKTSFDAIYLLKNLINCTLLIC